MLPLIILPLPLLPHNRRLHPRCQTKRDLRGSAFELRAGKEVCCFPNIWPSSSGVRFVLRNLSLLIKVHHAGTDGLVYSRCFMRGTGDGVSSHTCTQTSYSCNGAIYAFAPVFLLSPLFSYPGLCTRCT